MSNNAAGMLPSKPNATVTAAWHSSVRSRALMRRPYSEADTNSTASWPSGPTVGFVYRGPVGLRREKNVEAALVSLVEPEVAGDPQTGRLWLSRSLSRLQEGLMEIGHRLSRETVRQILLRHRIRAKVNVKRLVPKPHPDRDAQFRYIEQQRALFERMGWPVISVDTKYKELIGLFRQPGQIWCHQAPSVYMHDFPSEALGRAVPYGLYDVVRKQGFISLGQSADTPEFAVDSLLWWWQTYGSHHYSQAPELLILADSGGSNGCRVRNWKRQLQVEIADRFGLSVTVGHYPTGASKWNPIEHRLFSQVSKTISGVPLTSFELLLRLIGETKTATGLSVEARLVERCYTKGIAVTDEEMASLALETHATFPQWNYTIRPRNPGSNK